MAGSATSRADGKASISGEAGWGSTAADESGDRYVLPAGPIRVRILPYGGILQTVEMPDRRGKRADVALGFDNLPDYRTRNPYFGCLAGRHANRIPLGRFTFGGVTYRLPIRPTGSPTWVKVFMRAGTPGASAR